VKWITGFEAISLALEHEAWMHKPKKVPGNRNAVEWEVGILDVSIILCLLQSPNVYGGR
jgi:hypothetical protein